jgi:hypothetical protein
MMDMGRNMMSGTPVQKWPILMLLTDEKMKMGQRSETHSIFSSGEECKSAPQHTHHIHYIHIHPQHQHATHHTSYTVVSTSGFHRLKSHEKQTIYKPSCDLQTIYEQSTSQWTDYIIHSIPLLLPHDLSNRCHIKNEQFDE